MFRNNKLRLLMTLVGFERIGASDDKDATWIIPGSVSTEDLQKAHKAIETAESDPPTFDDEEGEKAEDFIRRKLTPRPIRNNQPEEDDSEGGGDDDDFIDGGNNNNNDDNEEMPLFPADAPMKRKSDALEEIKRKRRSRRGQDKEDDGNALTEAEREARLKARQEANLKKQMKIKSDLYVHESDDEENDERDQEFFAKEEERRKRQGFKVLEALEKGIELGDSDEDDDGGQKKATKRGTKKRKSVGTKTAGRKRRKGFHVSPAEDDNEEEDTVVNLESSSASPAAHQQRPSEVDELVDTPMTSPQVIVVDEHRSRPGSSSTGSRFPQKAEKSKSAAAPVDLAGDDDGDEDDMPVQSGRRRRHIGPFVEDDSE